MKKMLQKGILLAMVLVAGVVTESAAQFSPHNDTTIAFAATTNGFGRVQSYDGTDGKYDDVTDKMIDRLYQVVGFDDSYVWNTNDDPDVNLVDTVYFSSTDSVEYFRHLVMDNSYRSDPPFDINVTTIVRQFKDENYALAMFGVKNVSDAPREFKLSVMLRSKFMDTYGNETLEWDDSRSTLYAFDSDGAIGIKSMTLDAVGASLLDYDDYDSTEPERDNARDFARWDAVSVEEFPTSSVVAGENGGYSYLNFGSTGELAVGDSSYVWIAFTHGADLDVVDDRLAEAQTKFDVITPIEKLDEGQPSEVSLRQNYPNPFNPSTQITFSVPEAQGVTLDVYNMLGQHVATLANNEMVSAGSHAYNFDASQLSSGVYLYKLSTANQSVVKKMTLIK
jgi:hypothetical protein